MNKLTLALLLALFAAPTYAVGVTIVTALAISATYGATVAAIAAFAINMAVSFVISKVLMPSNTTPGAAADPGVRIQVPPDTTRSIPIVYGDAYIGGKFVDAVMTTDSTTMYYVMAVSCISPDGQFTFDKTKFYYGDRLCTFDTTSVDTFERARVLGLTDGAGNVDTKMSGKIYIHLFRSTAAGVITNLDVNGNNAGAATPQNLMSNANGLAAGLEWAASGRQMNGLAFAIIKLVYSRDAETTQLLPVTFAAKHTLRGTGVAKPGDVWYDYMTNPVYGGAVDPAFVDYTNATALNTYSDQTITFNDYNGTPQTQPRYRINGVLDTNQNVLQNVDQIMTACDSWMTYDAPSGKWSVTINQATASSFAFDDSNIVGSITVGGIDITRSINQIEAKFPNATNRDQYDYVFLKVPTGSLYPNEPVNKSNVNYDLVNNSVQALYLANRLLEQAREDLNVSFKTTYVGIQTNAGDVVSVTNSYYGWTNKLFRVMQVQEVSLPDGNLGAQIQLAEYSAAVYDNFDIDQYTPVGNTDIVSGGYFSALSAPSIIDAFPDAVVPNFDIRCTIPTTGRVTAVFLYYTLSATPTPSQWALLDSQVLSNSTVLLPSSTFDFDDISLPTGNYYFAFKVGNDISQSELSPSTAVFNWSPTGNAGTNAFVGSFAPSSVLVPFDGTTADFSAAVTRLNGVSTLGQVQYVTAANDSAGSFVANTWRIGGSSTTGTGDIVKTGITIGNPTVSGLSALFPVPTAMSSTSATVTVPIRYKNGSNQVFQISSASVQFVYATRGSTARICYSKTTLSSLSSTPTTITTTGSASFPPNNSWGTGTVWQATAPTIVAGESVYQSDGIYNPTTNQTVWNVPYLSALKVGSLSAISANLGTVTAGTMTIGDTTQGLYVNNSAYPNAVYVFQNSQTVYGLNVQNAYNTNNGGGSANFSSNYGFTLNSAIQVDAANPNGALKNCAIAVSAAAGGGQAFIGVTSSNGAYAGYAVTGTWSPFTGSHDGLIEIGTAIDSGDILIDSEIIATKVSDSLTVVTKSAAPNQVGAIGIFVSQRPLLAGVPAALMIDGVITDPTYVDTLALTYNNTVINGVGEGAVNCCGEGGDISIGDLIVTSSTAGKGMKQADNIVRSYSVARARQAVTFASPTEVKLVACIYLCG